MGCSSLMDKSPNFTNMHIPNMLNTNNRSKTKPSTLRLSYKDQKELMHAFYSPQQIQKSYPNHS